MSQTLPSSSYNRNACQRYNPTTIQRIPSTSSVVPLLLDEKWSKAAQKHSLARSAGCERETQSSLFSRTSSTFDRVASTWDPLSQPAGGSAEEAKHSSPQQVQQEITSSKIEPQQEFNAHSTSRTSPRSFRSNRLQHLQLPRHVSYITSASDTFTAKSSESDTRSTKPLLHSSAYDAVDNAEPTFDTSASSITSRNDKQTHSISARPASQSACARVTSSEAPKSRLLPSSTLLGLDRFIVQPQSITENTNTTSTKPTSSSGSVYDNRCPMFSLSTEELIDMMFNSSSDANQQGGKIAELGSRHRKSVHWEDAEINRRATAIDEILDSYFPPGVNRLSQLTKHSFLGADGQACPALRRKRSIRDLEKEAARDIFHAKSDWQDQGKINQFLKSTTRLHNKARQHQARP